MWIILRGSELVVSLESTRECSSIWSLVWRSSWTTIMVGPYNEASDFSAISMREKKKESRKLETDKWVCLKRVPGFAREVWVSRLCWSWASLPRLPLHKISILVNLGGSRSLDVLWNGAKQYRSFLNISQAGRRAPSSVRVPAEGLSQFCPLLPRGHKLLIELLRQWLPQMRPDS